MTRTVDDAAGSRTGNWRASWSRRGAEVVAVAAIVLVAACTGEPTPSPQQAPSPPEAMPTTIAPAGSGTPSSRAQPVDPATTPEATATPTPEPTVPLPVGSGRMTVAGSRGEVIGDCSLQGAAGRARSLSPRARLHVAVVAQPGEGDGAVHTAVVEPTDRGLRVRLERELGDVDLARGQRRRAWAGPVDQARLGRVGDAGVGTVSLNATLQPAPGAPSLPVTAATPTPRSTATPTPGGPGAATPEPRRPTARPAPVPDTARPVRVALAVACRVTADLAE